MSRFVKEWTDEAIYECRELSNRYRMLDLPVILSGTFSESELSCFQTLRSELSEEITVRETNLRTKLESIPVNRYTMQFIVEAHSIRNQSIKRACLNALVDEIIEHDEDSYEDLNMMQSMFTIFIHTLRNESDLTWKTLIMQSVQQLTRVCYASNFLNRRTLMDLRPLLQEAIIMQQVASLSTCLSALHCISNLVNYTQDCDFSVLMAEQFMEHHLLDQLNHLWMTQNFRNEFLELIVIIPVCVLSTISNEALIHVFKKQLYQAIWLALYFEDDSNAMTAVLIHLEALFGSENKLLPVIYELLNDRCSQNLMYQKMIKQRFTEKHAVDLTLFDWKLKQYKKEHEIVLPVALESLIRKYFMV